ncbi:hypothetical protein PROFUN_11257 [Planoprotostelium fungivorum]|uniref:Uncharacterized protein n=1 Tax=Planoprotostelium fungivorum TaxID=1890364 RepID=A0A2P6NAE0_9EUKA|nr:hypothetical protein PROFUN_11257 [Planoprotostelium fungivorum]
MDASQQPGQVTLDPWEEQFQAVLEEGTKEELEKMIEEDAGRVEHRLRSLTPLMIACYNPDPLVFSTLLRKGSKIDARTDNGNTVLMYAALTGNVPVVKMLLDIHINLVDQMNKQGDTPLMYACMSGSLECAEELLKSGANVNHRSQAGMSPLLCATKQDHPHVVKLLLDGGADVFIKDNKGRQAGQMCQSGKCKDVIQERMERERKLLLKSVKGEFQEKKTKPNNKKKLSKVEPKRAVGEEKRIEEKKVIEEKKEQRQEESEEKPVTQSSMHSTTNKEDRITPATRLTTKKNPNGSYSSIPLSHKTVKRDIVEISKKTSPTTRPISSTIGAEKSAGIPTTTSQTAPSPPHAAQMNAWSCPLATPQSIVTQTSMASPSISSSVTLDELVWRLHEQAEPLGITANNMLNIDLDTMSMEQLCVLEEMHTMCMRKIQERKLNEVRRQERLIVEEATEIHLEIELLRKRMT